MKIFVDTNVQMTVMLPEQERFDAAAHFLSLAQDSRHKLFATAMSLGDSFFMLEKKYGHATARRKIAGAAARLFMAPCDEDETRKALAEKRVTDFEDGLQYFAALHARCKYIVTYGASGFYYSVIPILTPEDFLAHYIKQRK